MIIADIPDPIRLVLQRRVYSAPDDLQQSAFHASPVKTLFWRNDFLHILAFGSPDYIRQLRAMDERFGCPLVGIRKEAVGVTVFGIANARRLSIIGGKYTRVHTIASIGHIASVFVSGAHFSTVETGHQLVQYDVQSALIGGLGNGFGLEELADDFDFMLARFLSPLLLREPA